MKRNPFFEYKGTIMPIKRKKTFGTVAVDHMSPQLGDPRPRGINIHLSFEEALKLHLGLSQIRGGSEAGEAAHGQVE